MRSEPERDDSSAIDYIAVESFPRRTIMARSLRWMSGHPALAGGLTGLLAVVVAAIKSHAGVANAPLIALALGAVVVVAWIAFFYMASPWLGQLASREEDFPRRIEFGPDHLTWIERGEARLKLDAPDYTIFGSAVPPEQLQSRRRKHPTPAWLVVDDEHGRFVLETVLTAEEAARYPVAPSDVVEGADDYLPTTLASPLLGMAERRLDRS